MIRSGRLTLLIFFASASLWARVALAGVERAVLTSGVQARAPVDDLRQSASIDPTSVTTLYFHTEVHQMDGKQLIHRWFYNDKQMAAVTLPINAERWRTHSSKRILPQWSGSWRIEVWSEQELLLSHPFSVETR